MRLVSISALLMLVSQDAAAAMSARAILNKALEIDAWGFGSAVVSARALLKNKRGSTKVLVFTSKSRRYAPLLSKSLVRFSAPADIAGTGFLQIQKKGGDDKRYLYLPALKRSRRIAGALRNSAFMGTDFSYADLDRRDLREGEVTRKPDEQLGKYSCYRLTVVPKNPASRYSRVELWVRKDNFVQLKTAMYDRSGQVLKSLTVRQIRRIKGRWFITKSLMLNHRRSHSTLMLLEQIDPRDDVPFDELTVRALGKL